MRLRRFAITALVVCLSLTFAVPVFADPQKPDGLSDEEWQNDVSQQIEQLYNTAVSWGASQEWVDAKKAESHPGISDYDWAGWVFQQVRYNWSDEETKERIAKYKVPFWADGEHGGPGMDARRDLLTSVSVKDLTGDTLERGKTYTLVTTVENQSTQYTYEGVGGYVGFGPATIPLVSEPYHDNAEFGDIAPGKTLTIEKTFTVPEDYDGTKYNTGTPIGKDVSKIKAELWCIGGDKPFATATKTVNVVDASNILTDPVTPTTPTTQTEPVQQTESVDVSYRTHVQDYGTQDWVYNGGISGTTGQSKRLEGIWIQASATDQNQQTHAIPLIYQTHVQNYGWQDWKNSGEMAGTSGQALRLEAIRINFGDDTYKTKYDIYYRVHAQNFGWLAWAKNGESSGTEGYAFRLEAIQILILPKGNTAPSASYGGIVSQSSEAFNKIVEPTISYRTHVQNIGWQPYVTDGAISGTVGKSWRLEAINMSVSSDPYISGGITYCTHVQNIGWQDWKSNGEISGTTGRSLRLEAIKISLTGDLANYYDVYYRAHAQNFGWLAWVKNGAPSGTAGYSYRLEGIQVVLVKKGATPPADNNFKGASIGCYSGFLNKVYPSFPTLKSLGINYSAEKNQKVDREMKRYLDFLYDQGVNYSDLDNMDKASTILIYVGSNFTYGDGSYDVGSMIDKRYGTCFAFSDLVYCMVKKVGLSESYLTVPGRNVDYEGHIYGSLHRTVVSKINERYYDLDGNRAMLWPGIFGPDEITKSYFDYLRGASNSYSSIQPS
ncbi:MAG: hypothetical protein ACI4ET_08610 [Bilifractor sp.]